MRHEQQWSWDEIQVIQSHPICQQHEVTDCQVLAELQFRSAGQSQHLYHDEESPALSQACRN